MTNDELLQFFDPPILPKQNMELMDKYRFKTGEWRTENGNSHGLFFVPINKISTKKLKVICSGIHGLPEITKDWYHTSVSLPDRCPTWEEMAVIKDIFFGPDTTAVQFMPKKSDYVNLHNYCLHIWLNLKYQQRLPPTILV